MRNVTQWPRRTKAMAATLTGALALTTAAILITPQAREAIAGPSDDQVALQRSQARAEDLKAQLDAANAKLSQPRPQVEDKSAQVADLRSQLEAADKKLARPRPLQTDPSAQARAQDLKGQLTAAEDTIGDLSGEASDTQVQKARAEDLSEQLHAAQAQAEDLAAKAGDNSQQARANDLKDQLDAASQTVSELSEQASNGQVQGARAQDLKTQLDAASQNVADLSAQVADGQMQGARADDLKGQLANAETKIAALSQRAAQLPVEQARAADLKAQVEELSRKLSEPPTPAPAPPVVASMTKSQILQARQQFGLYTQQSPFDYSEFLNVEASVDRQATISGYFQSWSTDFRPDAVQAAWKRDEIPLLTWESQAQVGDVTSDQSEFSLSNIINGDKDDYIRKYAQDITTTGLPLIIRFDHEMNGTWYPWSEVRGWDHSSVNGNHKGDFVKMWRHVHDIFQEEGANDYVVWLWAPNRVNNVPSQPDPEAFYPGSDYVDWVGMSAYFRPDDSAPTFDYVYGKTLPLLSFAGKPVFLAETGAGGTREKKTAFIQDFFAHIDDYPQVNGFAWFNLAVPVEGGTNDWRINVDPKARAAFAQGLADTGFGRPMD